MTENLSTLNQTKSAETKPSLHEEAVGFEKQAQLLRGEGKIEEAFETFQKAAFKYQKLNEHLKSALCFASAATCWNIHTGWQPLHQAARSTHAAAREAMKAKNYEYARSLYQEAAHLFEKEGDSENYSICYIESQHADRRRSWEIFLHPSRVASTGAYSGLEIRWQDRIVTFFRWFMNVLGDGLWGHGECPFRTLAWIGLILFGCAGIYSISSSILVNGVPRTIDFGEALYMSVITFSTVGYGDYLPFGWVRGFVMLEALSGIFFMPLFLVGLARRYLRMYR